MLVEYRPRQVEISPVEHQARAREAQGQSDALGHRHAAEEHRHREGGNLALGQAAVMDAANDEVDLLRAELVAVALTADDLLRQQAHA